ncbi:MAG: DUF4352 domain-containing protein [Turicibacter sp.]|nr:DUF4352 domain-containing protein [Turicibacter sp.]
MPDIKSIFLLCSFLCFITGIFSPEIIIKWGIPSLKTRRHVLLLFGGTTLLLVVMTQIGEALPETYYKDFNEPEESSNIFVFSPVETDKQLKIYKVADTGYTNYLEIELLNQETSVGNENYIADEGYEFVQLDLRVTNKLEEDYVLDLNHLQLQTNSLELLSPIFENLEETKVNLSARESVELSLVYLQPSEESYLTLSYLPHATETSEVEEIEIEETVSKIGDVLEVNQAMIQVHEVNRLEHPTKNNMEYIEVLLSIKNSTDHPVTYYPFYFELTCDSSANGIKSVISGFHVNRLEITELAGGGMITGALLFEVPKDATDLALNYREMSLFTQKNYEINLMNQATDVLPLQSELVMSEKWQTVKELDDWQLNVLDTQLLSETNYVSAKENQQFIIVGVELTNLSAKEQDYSAFDFKLLNEQGVLIMPSLLLIDNQTELTSGTLASEESVAGYLLFEDSDSYKNFQLLYSPDSWRSSECIIQPLSYES